MADEVKVAFVRTHVLNRIIGIGLACWLSSGSNRWPSKVHCQHTGQHQVLVISRCRRQ